MLSAEPVPTAILMTVFGALLAVSVAFSRASERSRWCSYYMMAG